MNFGETGQFYQKVIRNFKERIFDNEDLNKQLQARDMHPNDLKEKLTDKLNYTSQIFDQFTVYTEYFEKEMKRIDKQSQFLNRYRQENANGSTVYSDYQSEQSCHKSQSIYLDSDYQSQQYDSQEIQGYLEKYQKEKKIKKRVKIHVAGQKGKYNAKYKIGQHWKGAAFIDNALIKVRGCKRQIIAKRVTFLKEKE